jgi:D-alanine-D-alanine ligase
LSGRASRAAASERGRSGAPRPSVLILHNAPCVGQEPWRESDAGVLVEIRAVEAALDSLGYARRTVGVQSLRAVPDVLAAAPEPVVFNLVESLAGGPAEATPIPALCHAFGKACTGGGTPCLGVALDKGQTKAMLQMAGLPCPRGVVVPRGQNVRPGVLPRGRYIVKPVGLDASEGIGPDCVVRLGGKPMREALRRVHEAYGQAALVEEFIDGRELNVSLLERGGTVEVLPLAEIDFSAFPKDRLRVVDYAAKWLSASFEYRNTPLIVPTRLPAPVAARVRQVVREAWRVLGCRDYARVDLRLGADGSVYILEVNPNPDLSPEAGFAATLAAAGIPFEAFVETVVLNAMARAGKGGNWDSGFGIREGGNTRCQPGRSLPNPAVRIRPSEPRDRDAVLAFMAETGFFRDDEMEVAREVLDEALAKGPAGPYQSFVAEEGGRPVGWVCFGPTPCTVGTFDLYWIGVARDRQGKGVGVRLAAYAEDLIRRRGGRLAVVETSGRAVYDPTRLFYAKLGYREAARVRDFYAPGDDKIIYVKSLTPCGEAARDT